MKTIFKDVSGSNSSTRIFEFMIVLTVISISFISVLSGKDIGINIARMLETITPSVIVGCEIKKAVEHYSKNKLNKGL